MPGSPGTVPAPDLPPGPRLALVIATTTYTDPELRQLRAPAQDLADLRQVLADPEVGGFTVTSVINQPAHAIRLAVEDFLADRGTDDVLLVYLSCHGLLNAYRRLFFAAKDTRKDRLGATGVEAAWVMDQMEHCRARQQILILDSCFSGAFGNTKGDADVGLSDRFTGQGRGRIVLTASNATEYSYEGEPVEGAVAAGSVFTAALVDGLRTGAADTDHDGHITVEEAYTYAYDRVRAKGAAQTPQRWAYKSEGTIVLARSPAGRVLERPALPEALRAALGSPLPGVRIAAVSELGAWLNSGDPAQEHVALEELREIAGREISQVRDAASSLLAAYQAAGAAAGVTTEDSGPEAPAGRSEPEASQGTKPQPRRRSPQPPAPRTGDAARPHIPSKLLHTFAAVTPRINSLTFSPDGKVLAAGTGSVDAAVLLWNPLTGERLRILSIDRRYADSSVAAQISNRWMAFSPDGRQLATSGNTLDCVWLWDRTIGWARRKILMPRAVVIEAGFSSDARRLAVACKDMTVYWYDTATGERATGERAAGERLSQVSIGLPGLRERRIETLKRAVTRDTGLGRHVSMRLSPGLRTLAVMGDVDMVFLVDPWNGRSQAAFGVFPENLPTAEDESPARGGPAILAFSPDGNLLAVAGFPRGIELRDVATREIRHRDSGMRSAGAAFSPDGRVLAVGQADKVLLLDSATGEQLGVLAPPRAASSGTVFNRVAFSPLDGTLAVAESQVAREQPGPASDDGATIRVWA